MSWLRKRRTAALDDLLARLDALAATGNVHAEADAAQIRRHGDRALRRLVGESARIVAECSVWATDTKVTAAFVQYEKATTGADLARIPAEQVRDRRARSAAQAAAQRALRRREDALASARDRANQRLLAQMRAATTRRTP